MLLIQGDAPASSLSPRHNQPAFQIDFLRRIIHHSGGPLLPNEEHLSGRV